MADVEQPGTVIHRSIKTVKTVSTVVWTEVVYRVGIPFYYRHAALDESRIVRGIAYREGGSAHPEKHRLDLYMGAGSDWPVLIFVHGGGWNTGDRALTAGGHDVYANIGRYFAARGIGCVVPSYRLQPGAAWSEQADDIASAACWVRRSVAGYGGDPESIVLSGHSAGAQLAAWVAFDPVRRRAADLDSGAVRGLVCVSGAALDLEDRLTYELGADPAYYERRFANGTPGWRRDGSPVGVAGPHCPPTLIMYAGGDYTPLKRQAAVLESALVSHGVPCETVVVPGQTHSRILLTLSRPDRTAAPAIESFVHRVAAGKDRAAARLSPSSRTG